MFSSFIKLLFVIKIFVLSIFEWPFYTGFTVVTCQKGLDKQYCLLSEKHFVNSNLNKKKHFI